MNKLEELLFPGRDIRKEWNSRITSKKIPGIIKTNLTYDPVKLHQAMTDVIHKRNEKTNDIYENDVILDCLGIAGKLPETYYTYVLTTPTQRAIEAQQEIDKLRGVDWKERQRLLSRKRLLKSVISLNSDYDPLMDERNFTVLKNELKDTYFEEVLALFEARVARTRISTIKASENVRTHVDANAKYVLRAHIPIVTNKDAISYYYDIEGNRVEVHMELGSVYIINPGVSHGAINNGTEERVHLVVGLDGQDDILPFL